MTSDTVKIEEPDPNESFLDRLQREGKLDQFIQFLGFLIVSVITIAIVVGVLCYFSRKQPQKRQHAFDAYVYIDLAAKTEMRCQNVQAEIVKVQKEGYKPKPKIKPF